MRTLIAEPYRPLDVKHNSPLLMIFEGFRNLRDENASLVRKLKYEVETRFSSHHELELERQRWQREREEYQAEVKRLELIISKDKEGVAEVLRARRGSLLRNEHRRRTASGANTNDDSRETLVEFLQRTRIEDERRQESARKSQRGMPIAPPLVQTSERLTLTVPFRARPVSPSQKMAILSHKFSTTNHYSDFESPPSPHDFTSLSQASMFEMLAGRTSLSDTDSSENDFAQQQDAVIVDEDEAATVTNVDAILFPRDGDLENKSRPVDYFGFRTPSFETGSTERLTPRAPRSRPESLRLEHARKFSFEYNDDNRPVHARHLHAATSPLQRSMSVDHFAAKQIHGDPSTLAADSAVSSPIRTSMSEFPGISKIPSPVFDPSLARPRREDSSSSFLTAIRAPEGDSNHSRATSRSSFHLDSPQQSTSLRGSGDFGNSQRHSGRYGSMHDVNMAVAAAARAAAPSNSPKPSAELRASYHANA